MENFPHNWPFVRGIHRSPVNSPHKGQWRGALMFSLIGAWINDWVNNREAGDLRRNRVHYDVIVMHHSVRFQIYIFQRGNMVTNAFQSIMDQSKTFSTVWEAMWFAAQARIHVSCEPRFRDEMTHWGRNKIIDIFNVTFSNAFFFSNKIFVLLYQFDSSSFPMIWLTIST